MNKDEETRKMTKDEIEAVNREASQSLPKKLTYLAWRKLVGKSQVNK